jgi:SAM-dependent methyltransferase
MEREVYRGLVERSDYSSDAFATVDDAEHVVGCYAQHERFDYERWLLGGVTVRPGAIALEYGCGPARMLLRLAPRFTRVDGVDISSDVIEVARRRIAAAGVPAQVWVNSGDGLPPEVRDLYDLAYSVICLQHICVHTIRRRILHALFDALKPGGVLTFQMGYGPGHPAMADYLADVLDATGTNGAHDVGVLHPGEIGRDLQAIGFARAAYALTPTGPGDTHGAWIFVRAQKPGSGARIISTPQQWTRAGFVSLDGDADDTIEQARRLHLDRGLVRQVSLLAARCHHLEGRARELEVRGRQLETGRQQAEADRQRIDVERQRIEADARTLADRYDTLEETSRRLTEHRDALDAQVASLEALRHEAAARNRELTARTQEVEARNARLDLRCRDLEAVRIQITENAAELRMAHDAWRERAAEWKQATAQAEEHTALQRSQLLRVQAADRARVRALVDRHVDAARRHGWSIALFGAGAHSEWLLRETALAEVPRLHLFDTRPELYGGRAMGLPVRPAAHMAQLEPDIVIVSSLAFQEEMAAFVEGLGLRRVHVVRCYP